MTNDGSGDPPTELADPAGIHATVPTDEPPLSITTVQRQRTRNTIIVVRMKHLCAVDFYEAAEMAIDNLEHGLQAASELGQLARTDILTDVRIQQLIAGLVRRGVALTSALATIETFTGENSAADEPTPCVLATRLRMTCPPRSATA
jgi:hypothetical protein